MQKHKLVHNLLYVGVELMSSSRSARSYKILLRAVSEVRLLGVIAPERINLLQIELEARFDLMELLGIYI